MTSWAKSVDEEGRATQPEAQEGSVQVPQSACAAVPFLWALAHHSLGQVGADITGKPHGVDPGLAEGSARVAQKTDVVCTRWGLWRPSVLREPRTSCPLLSAKLPMGHWDIMAPPYLRDSLSPSSCHIRPASLFFPSSLP